MLTAWDVASSDHLIWVHLPGVTSVSTVRLTAQQEVLLCHYRTDSQLLLWISPAAAFWTVLTTCSVCTSHLVSYLSGKGGCLYEGLWPCQHYWQCADWCLCMPGCPQAAFHHVLSLMLIPSRWPGSHIWHQTERMVGHLYQQVPSFEEQYQKLGGSSIGHDRMRLSWPYWGLVTLPYFMGWGGIVMWQLLGPPTVQHLFSDCGGTTVSYIANVSDGAFPLP